MFALGQRRTFRAAKDDVCFTPESGHFMFNCPLWGAETTPEASTRGVVGVAQDVRLELQIFQTMLDYIADADDTGAIA
jgi:hypothetical protein